MNNELVVLAFPDKGTMREARARLRELSHDGFIKIHNLAMVERDKRGHTSVHEMGDLDLPHGLAFGTVVGILIGLGSGLPGIALGLLAGGTTGGLAARLIDMGMTHGDLRAIEQALPPGSAAIVLQIAPDSADRVPDVIAGLPVRLMRHQTLATIVERLHGHEPAPDVDAALETARATSREARAALYEGLLRGLDQELTDVQKIIETCEGTIHESLLARAHTLRVSRAVWWQELQHALAGQIADCTAQIALLESRRAGDRVGTGPEIARLEALRTATADRLAAGQAAQRAAWEAELAEMQTGLIAADPGRIATLQVHLTGSAPATLATTLQAPVLA
jgi:uncharacterized membrane protein